MNVIAFVNLNDLPLLDLNIVINYVLYHIISITRLTILYIYILQLYIAKVPY